MPRLIESIAPKLAAMLENQPQTDLSANPFEAVGMALGVIMEAMAEFNDEFAAAGTNFQDFSAFGNIHKAEIDAYLENDPESKAKMDELQAQMQGLMGQNP